MTPEDKDKLKALLQTLDPDQLTEFVAAHIDNTHKVNDRWIAIFRSATLASNKQLPPKKPLTLRDIFTSDELPQKQKRGRKRKPKPQENKRKQGRPELKPEFTDLIKRIASDITKIQHTKAMRLKTAVRAYMTMHAEQDPEYKRMRKTRQKEFIETLTEKLYKDITKYSNR